MHPYLAKESYTYLISSLYIMHLQCVRVHGRILHAQTYPLQGVDGEEGDGRLIRGGRLIRTLRYTLSSNLGGLSSALRENGVHKYIL